MVWGLGLSWAWCHSYGDWCNVPGSPKCNDHLVASFSLIQNLEQMIVLANALDNYDDVSTYRSYLRLFRAEFHGTLLLCPDSVPLLQVSFIPNRDVLCPVFFWYFRNLLFESESHV